MKYPGLLLTFFIPFILSAQKNFKPGSIVNLKGDTISGLIDYKEWKFSPTHILFKPSGDNANAEEYDVNDISSFDITGKEAYRRAVVKISLNKVKLEDIGGRDTSWKTDTVFLKVLHAGKLASLFSYTDRIKDRFYILEEGQQEPTELIMRQYIKESAVTIISENTYKDQLKRFQYTKGISNDKLRQRIEEAVYDEHDLKRIFTLINGADNENQIEGRKNRMTYWFAGAGVQRDNLSFKGNHQFARNLAGDQLAWLPRISAGLDLFANPNVGKLFYRIEAGYQINRSKLIATLPDDVKAVYELSGSTITLQAQVNYALYNSDKLKIPVSIGMVYSYNSYSKNQYKKVYDDGTENSHVEDWLSLKKSNTTYFGRASVVFHNKIEASFLYRPSVNLTKTINYRLTASNMQLEVYYLFRQNK